MKQTIRLTESELHGLIRECIEEIIYESRLPLTEAFQSQKLAQIVQQHGGLDSHNLTPDVKLCLNGLQDSDIIGVGTRQQFEGTNNPGMFQDPIVLRDGMVVGIKKGAITSQSQGYQNKMARDNNKSIPGVQNQKASYDGEANQDHFENPYAQQYLANRSAAKKYGQEGNQQMADFHKSGMQQDASRLMNWHKDKMAQGPNPAFK